MTGAPSVMSRRRAMKVKDATDNYDDIINLEHPTSQVFPRMPMTKRASHFAPFAALSGFREMIAKCIEEVQEEYAQREKGVDMDMEDYLPWNNMPSED